jgi:ferric iron reductase protein FhuF
MYKIETHVYIYAWMTQQKRVQKRKKNIHYKRHHDGSDDSAFSVKYVYVRTVRNYLTLVKKVKLVQ